MGFCGRACCAVPGRAAVPRRAAAAGLSLRGGGLAARSAALGGVALPSPAQPSGVLVALTAPLDARVPRCNVNSPN